MGCFCSKEAIDFDLIEPIVLRIRTGSARFSGTTEHGRCQVCQQLIMTRPRLPLLFSFCLFQKTLGDAELAVTNDCLYSQVPGRNCLRNHGLLRIPILSIRNIQQHSCENGVRLRQVFTHCESIIHNRF
jgi:hypothetical protein